MKYNFSRFIAEKGGAAKLAETLGITSHCVRNWARGDGPPKRALIRRLVQLSKNRLTYESIIRYTTRNQK